MAIETLDESIAKTLRDMEKNNMGKTYAKIAKAVLNLEEKVHDYPWIPVGFDGYVAASLMNYVQNMQEAPKSAFLENIVYASSKTGKIDEDMLGQIKIRYGDKRQLALVDMRTKTGALGEMLRQAAGKIGIKAKYAVLFDPSGKADIRGSMEELTDDERPKWLDNKGQVDSLIRAENGEYICNIWPHTITSLKHVPAIECYITEEILGRIGYYK